MQQSSVLCALALALLSGPVLAEESGDKWIISSDVKHCVTSRMDEFLSNFSGGGVSACPYECANCLTDPLQCLVQCANKEAACACSQAIPQALDSLAACCEYIWDIFEGACRSAVRSLGETVVNQISNICSANQEELQAEMREAPGSLLVKTRTTLEEGVVALISGMQAGAVQHPGVDSLLELQSGPAASLAQEQGSDEYVGGHRMGAACVSLLDGIESEHAAGADEAQVPDLRAAAEKISQRTSALLGRDLPELKTVVHRALAVAWSEDGPGMDSREVCEVILRHHDSL